jgi:hypothetical protein
MADKNKKRWFRRHKILTTIGVLIVIIIIASAAGGGNKNKNSSSSTKTNSSSKATIAKIGQAARDGKFEFTVNSVKCGVPNVGSDYSTKTAQGQYCLLDATVKNIGSEAQSLYSGNQYLYNAANQKYSADDLATIDAQPVGSAGSSWFNDINPGNQVEGTIVFDIPKDQTPVSAELHDSALSGGIKVSLQ